MQGQQRSFNGVVKLQQGLLFRLFNLKGVSKSVQVLFDGIEAAMVMTLMILK